jgi:F420-non-reducing hydrogenase iron-sulfur subunit
LNITTTKRLKLYIFFCSNSIDVNEFTGLLQDEEGIEYRNISLPCSGKANLLYLIKAFETGADGLLLITCGKNQCHYLEGNLRSPKRADEVNILLDEIGMGKERIAVVTIDGDGMESVLAKVKEFREKITGLAACHE